MNKKHLTEQELYLQFLNICRNGDLVNFKLLHKEYYVKNHSPFSSFLKIFNNKPTLRLDDVNSTTSQILLMSAMSGQYEIVKELLNDKTFVKKINKNGLLRKSLGGILSPQRLTLNSVEYSVFKKINDLMYESLIDKDEFHSVVDLKFMDSCQHGDLNTLKYLIENPIFKEHLIFEDKKMSNLYSLIKISSLEVLHYLIIEHHMDENKKFMERVLQTFTVLSIIEKKKLNYELTDNLDVNNKPHSSNKKMKL
jgi:hypothetical protein